MDKVMVAIPGDMPVKGLQEFAEQWGLEISYQRAQREGVIELIERKKPKQGLVKRIITKVYGHQLP